MDDLLRNLRGFYCDGFFMTDTMRDDFEEFVQSQADTQGNYVGDHYELWQAATLAERERCANLASDEYRNGSGAELARNIRSGK